MNKGHHLTRIVTYMGNPSIGLNPQEILKEGSRVISFSGKVRYFTVRKVFYDESLTPMFTLPDLGEPKCLTLEELKSNHPYYTPVFDSPILDNDHSLKIWNP